MDDLEQINWFCGDGSKTSISYIAEKAVYHINNGAKIFIGTDSFLTKRKINFASAICFYGADLPSRYFFCKTFLEAKKYNNLVTRITEEARRSVILGEYLIKKYNLNAKNIELHLDISPFSACTKSSKFSEMLKGYVMGAGFSCKIKPNAWASQSVADKHSK